MLSLVPVVAMLVAVAKVFGIRDLLEKELEIYFSGQEEILNNVLPFADRMLNDAGGGLVTGFSVVILIFTVIRLLMNIEEAFNDMWDIKQSRRWERKISDYVAVILLGPVLVIVASSATLLVKDTIQGFIADIEFLGQLRSGIIFLLKLLPYTILWFLLFGIYLIFPNIRVKVFPALLGGIVAGTLYNLNQEAFISLQFAFAKYDAVYGGIAFLPLFLIWLQISWLIVLFGAEVVYGAQFMNEWEYNSEKRKISIHHRKKLMILLLHKVVKKFEEGAGPIPLSEMMKSVNVPRRYVIDIADEMEKAGLIIKVEADDVSYQPCFDINKMDLNSVIKKYESEGMKDFDPRKSVTFKHIEKSLKEVEDKWASSPANILIKDLN